MALEFPQKNNTDKRLARLLKSIDKLPDTPGVYIFKGSRGEKLYIGKATSLRSRVRSYARADIADTRGPLIVAMFGNAAKVDYIETNSVLEALILEANLIKKYLPPHNTKDKDNKSFNYVVITREKFPRVLLRRGREVAMLGRDEEAKQYRAVFGPFPSGSSLREALKIVRRIFPYRDMCVPAEEMIATGKQPRPCFNSGIGLCPGVCSGAITAEEYAKTIRRIILFFEGNMKRLLRSLEKDMHAYARAEEFEKAADIRKAVFALQHIQDVSLVSRDAIEMSTTPATAGALGSVFRIEAYDIAHLGGSSTVGAMVVVEDGRAQTSEYRKFKIRRAILSKKGNDDVGNLAEMFTRRLAHPEWPMPQLIVVDGTGPQRRVVEDILTRRSLSIPIVSVVKDEAHKPRDIQSDTGLAAELAVTHKAAILIANSEAHRFATGYHKVRRGKDFLPGK